MCAMQELPSDHTWKAPRCSVDARIFTVLRMWPADGQGDDALISVKFHCFVCVLRATFVRFARKPTRTRTGNAKCWSAITAKCGCTLLAKNSQVYIIACSCPFGSTMGNAIFCNLLKIL